jgi:hypothetical protein
MDEYRQTGNLVRPESKFPGSPVNQAVVNIYQFALY